MSATEQRHSGLAVALGLLALLAVRHYGYKVAPAWAQPDVQNVCTAAMFIVGLCVILWRVKGWHVLGVLAWFAAEELLVAGCSVAYLTRGSPATDAGDQCTGLIGFDLNRLGVFIISLLLVSICKKYQWRK